MHCQTKEKVKTFFVPSLVIAVFGALIFKLGPHFLGHRCSRITFQLIFTAAPFLSFFGFKPLAFKRFYKKDKPKSLN